MIIYIMISSTVYSTHCNVQAGCTECCSCFNAPSCVSYVFLYLVCHSGLESICFENDTTIFEEKHLSLELYYTSCNFVEHTNVCEVFRVVLLHFSLAFEFRDGAWVAAVLMMLVVCVYHLFRLCTVASALDGQLVAETHRS